MEIQKIFSEVETGEVLYSCLMSEDELMIFSEAKKKDEDKTDRVLKKVAKGGAITALAGTGMSLAGTGLMLSGGQKFLKSKGAAGLGKSVGGAVLAGTGMTAAKYGAGTALAAGGLYGARKLYKKYKKNKD